MSAPPRYAGLVSKVLAKHDAQIAPPSEHDRARAIAAVASRMRAARRTRRLRYAFGLCAVAACIAFAVFGVSKWKKGRGEVAAVAPPATSRTVTAQGHVLEGSVTTVHEGHSLALVEGTTLGVGDRLVVDSGGRGSLVLSTGTQLVLEGGGSLAIVEQGHTQLYSLETGAVRAFVTKLAAEDRFLVRTADAEIEVRGTAFRVMRAEPDPACGSATTTRVEVSEGVVVVRASGVEERVTAGGHWPKTCSWSAESTATPSSASAKPASAPSSDLALQNELFAKAVAAKRSGDSVSALVGFERFLAKYPASPLAESAASERLKILSVVDRKRAVAAAKEYLARYPAGPSRKDAEAIVAKGAGGASGPSGW